VHRAGCPSAWVPDDRPALAVPARSKNRRPCRGGLKSIGGAEAGLRFPRAKRRVVGCRQPVWCTNLQLHIILGLRALPQRSRTLSVEGGRCAARRQLVGGSADGMGARGRGQRVTGWGAHRVPSSPRGWTCRIAAFDNSRQQRPARAVGARNVCAWVDATVPWDLEPTGGWSTVSSIKIKQ